MADLMDFFRKFFTNKGHYVFVSFLLAKICGFIIALLLIKFLSKEDYGNLSAILAIYGMLVTINGFGSYQILMRYGSLSDAKEEKDKLSSYLFFKGFWCELLIVILFIAISFWYVDGFFGALSMILLTALRLFGALLVSHIQSYYRIVGDNRTFAQISNVTNIGGVITASFGIYFFGLNGFLVAVAITPLFSLFFLKYAMIAYPNFIPKNVRAHWRYGVFAGLTSLVSEALFSLDILLLGILMDETAVANYRVAILLPSNITFLAISFLQTDFPTLSKNYHNRKFLENYVLNFTRLFVGIGGVICVCFYLLKEEIALLLFKDYVDTTPIMMVLMIGFVLAMLTRNLYGNLLPAVGKTEVNTWSCALALVVMAGVAYVLVPLYGVMGMAYTMVITLLFNGLTLMFYFFRYVKTLR